MCIIAHCQMICIDLQILFMYMYSCRYIAVTTDYVICSIMLLLQIHDIHTTDQLKRIKVKGYTT